MHPLTYERLLAADDPAIPELTAVYHTPEVAQYLSISDNYFHYVATSEGIYFYKVHDNSQLIGTLHLEKQGPSLYMSVLVLPAYQQMGYGTQILRDVKRDAFGLDCQHIEVSIDVRNSVSLRLFRKAEFVCTAQEGELLTFVYERRTA